MRLTLALELVPVGTTIPRRASSLPYALFDPAHIIVFDTTSTDFRDLRYHCLFPEQYDQPRGCTDSVLPRLILDFVEAALWEGSSPPSVNLSSTPTLPHKVQFSHLTSVSTAGLHHGAQYTASGTNGEERTNPMPIWIYLSNIHVGICAKDVDERLSQLDWKLGTQLAPDTASGATRTAWSEKSLIYVDAVKRVRKK